MSVYLETTLAALADPVRLAVVNLLRQRRRCSSDLAAALSISPSAMSRHLRVLREAQLVEEESPASDARLRVYQLRREPFAQLREWAREIESLWNEQLRPPTTYTGKTVEVGGYVPGGSKPGRGKKGASS